MSRATTDFRARYGPWAVVAGASEGLGAEYATQLAAKGLNLVLIARRKELLDNLSIQLAKDYTVEVRTLELDLASDDIGTQVEAATRDIEVGLLIYNAATVVIGSFFEISLQTHLNELAVNCRAPMTLAYLLGQHMLKRKRGGIVLMSSLSASQGSPLIANYTATKAYNRLLAESLWDELRTQGIDVLACAPAVVSTPRAQESTPDSGTVSSTALPPRAVAAETLAALGKQPIIIPGRGNRLANLVIQRILPHKMAIQIMGRVMRSTYQKS
ncbi:MAG TPA: SDR family NAD(P)-dependent oxidoreductase [Ktedonobacteraceae bacterium]|nr:SDR family NAD(P)-dependent oxidoreductase [Ktedonobacteraceae bacterium]